MSDVLRNGEPLRFTLEPGGSVMAGGIRVRNIGSAAVPVLVELVNEVQVSQPRPRQQARLLDRIRRAEGQDSIDDGRPPSVK